MRNGPSRHRVFAGVAAIVCAAAMAVVSPAVAQERRGGTEPTVTVHGSGQSTAKPDFAVVTVEVATPGDTLDKAAAAHEARATRAAEALQKLAPEGVAVKRSDYRLVRDTGKPKPDQQGYRAVTAFELELKPVDRVNALVGRIASVGLFEVTRLGWRVEQSRAAVDEARRKAVADARAKAEVYADAAEMRLVAVLAITDGEGGQADGLADLPMPRTVQIVPPATLTFDASATMTWRIGPR